MTRKKKNIEEEIQDIIDNYNLKNWKSLVFSEEGRKELRESWERQVSKYFKRKILKLKNL